MRVHLALGDAATALKVYATLRARLTEELQVKPSADTLALAEYVRATAAASRGSRPSRPAATASRLPGELIAPLVGRAAAFTQLVGRYQEVRRGQSQAVLVVGEAGIGKTRLAREFGAWARAQGAEVLSGQAFERGGRLPYQPLVEAVRQRLEENAPEDLLEDLWLAELSRLLPEVRVRYPDLPAPTQDELTAKLRLFEAVARLLDALGQRAPLAAWEGHSEQAIGHLYEAAQVAVDIGLPAELWQIQAMLGRVYEAEGLPAQARTAWASAATIIRRLAEGIGDEALRTNFLAGPQIQPVLQQT